LITYNSEDLSWKAISRSSLCTECILWFWKAETNQGSYRIFAGRGRGTSVPQSYSILDQIQSALGKPASSPVTSKGNKGSESPHCRNSGWQ